MTVLNISNSHFNSKKECNVPKSSTADAGWSTVNIPATGIHNMLKENGLGCICTFFLVIIIKSWNIQGSKLQSLSEQIFFLITFWNVAW